MCRLACCCSIRCSLSSSDLPASCSRVRAADIGLRYEDEQVYDPFDPPLARLAPFRPWPVVALSDPASRRAKRIVIDRETRRTRRQQEGSAGVDGPAPFSLDSIHGATALLIERQLAMMQREERERLETKLLESAFHKAKSKYIKKDLGTNSGG